MDLRKMGSIGYYAGVLLPVTVVGTLAIVSISVKNEKKKNQDGLTGIASLIVVPIFIAPIFLLTGIAYRFGNDKTAKITLGIGIALLAVVIWFFNGGNDYFVERNKLKEDEKLQKEQKKQFKIGELARTQEAYDYAEKMGNIEDMRILKPRLDTLKSLIRD